MPRYELVEGTSSKFWEIEIAGTSAGTRMTTRWGRIGTAGQEKTKDFASPEKAQAEHDALVREKTGKGYRETGAAAAPAVPRPAPAAVIPPPPPPVAAAPQPEPEPVAPAPVTAGEELAIAWTPDLRSRALPRRDGGEVGPVRSDPTVAWKRIRERFAVNAQVWKASRSMSDDLSPVLRAVVRKLELDGAGLPPAADPEIEGALLVVLSIGDTWQEPPLEDEIVTVWTATGGLAFAVEALQASLGFQAAAQHGVTEPWLVRKTNGGGVASSRNVGFRHWFHLRRRLAAASEAEHAVARDTAERLRRGASLDHRVPLAYLFPETGWAEADAREFLAQGVSSRWKSGLLIPVVREPGLVLRLMESTDGGWIHVPWKIGGAGDAQSLALTLVDTLGTAAVGPLVRLLDEGHNTDRQRAVLDVIAMLPVAEAAEALASRIEMREMAGALSSFAARFPHLALPALAARASRAGSTVAASVLAQVVRRNPELATALLPDLPEGSRRAVETLLDKTELPPEAAVADLPPVLASPPWQRKGRRKEPPAVLDLPPLAWEETIHWPQGERERWLCAYVSGSWGRWKSEEERTAAILGNMNMQAFGPWKELDDAALRRKIAGRVAEFKEGEPSSLSLLPDRLALALWDTLPASAWAACYPPSRFVVEQELKALPGLARCAERHLAVTAPLFLPFRSPRLAPLAAEALARFKSTRTTMRRWFFAHDEAAAVGLIPAAVGPAGKTRDAAGAALRFLAANGRQELVLEVAGRWSAEAREAVRAVLDADPLDLFPARLPKMPAWWHPEGFARPLLRGRGAALPLSAVEALGAMLAFSSPDEPYAGLEEVRQACDPASLAAFAWDLFAAWLASGAAPKEAWALQALGHFGDDACARRLAPMIREWPGESAHARAVAGLDVLRAIGTDVALMHLHGISQKVKFKGLQDKAKEKIEEIAEQRGLTPEDLADRLVPDLGLGADGSLLLDFGPRSFRVAFDESLKPFVRDAEGKSLPDLPKPGKADDAEKAQQAQNLWKALKKDAKAVAANQIVRLELAMCGRRRWEPDVFRTFFLEHPLLRHLVRRLVWGAWDGEVSLTGTFRVSEDGSFADAADDVWELPGGLRVGLVHRLDLTDEQAARWGEVLSDYEILQPFAQIGREVRAITEEERGVRELRRMEGVTVPTGKVLGLAERRGWRRGPAQDAGIISWFTKPLPGGEHEAWLTLDPGIAVGMMMEFPEQKLGTVTIERRGSWDPEGEIAFGRLDPIVFSELVRDLESLRE